MVNHNLSKSKTTKKKKKKNMTHIIDKFQGADGKKENVEVNNIHTNLTPVKRKLMESETVQTLSCVFSDKKGTNPGGGRGWWQARPNS